MDSSRPFERLPTSREHRMDSAYPAEVQPLVDDLNALLDHRGRQWLAIANSGDSPTA